MKDYKNNCECVLITLDGGENYLPYLIGSDYTAKKYWDLVNAARENFKKKMGGDRFWLFVFGNYTAVLMRFSEDGKDAKGSWRLVDSGEFGGGRDDFSLIFNAQTDDCPIESVELSMDYPSENCDISDCYDYFSAKIAINQAPKIETVTWREI